MVWYSCGECINPAQWKANEDRKRCTVILRSLFPSRCTNWSQQKPRPRTVRFLLVITVLWTGVVVVAETIIISTTGSNGFATVAKNLASEDRIKINENECLWPHVLPYLFAFATNARKTIPKEISPMGKTVRKYTLPSPSLFALLLMQSHSHSFSWIWKANEGTTNVHLVRVSRLSGRLSQEHGDLPFSTVSSSLLCQHRWKAGRGRGETPNFTTLIVPSSSTVGIRCTSVHFDACCCLAGPPDRQPLFLDRLDRFTQNACKPPPQLSLLLYNDECMCLKEGSFLHLLLYTHAQNLDVKQTNRFYKSQTPEGGSSSGEKKGVKVLRTRVERATLRQWYKIVPGDVGKPGGGRRFASRANGASKRTPIPVLGQPFCWLFAVPAIPDSFGSKGDHG